MSPPSDNVIFDNQCYATTPSSSNGNSDMEQSNHCNSRRCNGGQTYQQNMQSVSTPGSPTSRLLLEYEMHLRNTLAKGMDAESYSLRTFEALLTQSMENLGKTSRILFFLTIGCCTVKNFIMPQEYSRFVHSCSFFFSSERIN